MSWEAGPVATVITTVRVAGVERDHETVSWEQDITSDLPSAVTAGGQVAHRTGTVVWASTGITTRPASPWASGVWLPTVGDPVTVDVSDGHGNTHRVFTGIIDTIEGNAFGRSTSRIVAAIKGANRTVRCLALASIGQPVYGGAARMLSTTPVWVVSEIARQLGYASVPTKPPYTRLILDAPLQGSTYVYSDSANFNAELVTSRRSFGDTVPVAWRSGPDGFGPTDSVLEWVPGNGGGTGAGAVGVALIVYSVHQADALVTVTHGDTGVTFVRVRGDRTVRATTRINGVDTYQELGTLPTLGDTPQRVSVVFLGGQISARIGDTTITAPAPTPTGAVTRMKLDTVDTACVAGLQVWHAQALNDHWAAGWTPTAIYRYGTGTQATAITPSVRDERAGDVLQDYADALLSPIWIDQYGRLQIVSGRAMHQQAPALEVDALRDVSELSYSVALLDHRPTVEVTYAHAHNSGPTATAARTMVWQGSGTEVTREAPDQTFVEVPDDEEWIGLSNPFDAQRYTYLTKTEFETGIGSWWGFSHEQEDVDWLVMNQEGDLQVETLTPWAWKLTATHPTVDGVVQKTEGPPTTKARYREVDLPIFRARALVRYEDRAVAITGDETAPGEVLHHEAGKWITTTVAANDLATWVHSMVGTPTPILEQLVVRFDPRIDVGLKITVTARDVFGVDFQALILSFEHNPYDGTTTVTARVTAVIAGQDSLSEVEYAHIGQSLTQWEDARAGRTLAQVAANPYL